MKNIKFLLRTRIKSSPSLLQSSTVTTMSLLIPYLFLFANGNLTTDFEASLAFATGVPANIMFSLTFVPLVYAKCCSIDLRSRSRDRRRQDSKEENDDSGPSIVDKKSF